MIRKQSLLYLGFGLVAIVWVLDRIALSLYLYWTVGWYDYLMHFLGGLTIGVLVIWLLGIGERSIRNFLLVFVVVMIVGGAWEVFEYLNGLTFSTQEYGPDLTWDLVMDAVGVSTAYTIATWRS